MEEQKKEFIFVDGVFYSKPRPGAPKTIRASLSVQVDTFIEFLNKHKSGGYVNIDMRWSEAKNTMYLTLNEWKKPEGLNDAPRASQPLTDLSPAELEIIKKAREAEQKAQEKGIDPEKVFQDF